MIVAKNISKYFGAKPAVENVSFEIAPGEIVGFLGPNGAGKTTLMRILTSYLPPTRGSVLLAGFDVQKDSLLARQKLGYLPETPPLYPDMSIRRYLKFAAELKGVPTLKLNVQIDRALTECGLQKTQHQTIGTLSKGYKQRVGIAQAIIHDPEVLILDEPASGLDPIQILQVRKLIKAFERKRTIILSTHILSEIEQIAHRILIIQKGKIISDSPLHELLKNYLTLENAFLTLTAAP